MMEMAYRNVAAFKVTEQKIVKVVNFMLYAFYNLK
jgi:hypothetical protein